MKKIATNALIFVIFLSVTFFPLKTKAESGFMLGSIQNAAVGSYVSLGGRTWRLIGDNYIMLNQPISSMALGKNNYVTYASSDIRAYLNNDFLNGLGSSTRLVTYNEWGIGTEASEYNLTVNDKISLPSYSDMQTIQNILGKQNNNMWTRTQLDSNKAKYSFWVLNTKNGSFVQQLYSNKADVYPVLIISPNVIVNGKGTEKNPYVISEISGQTDKTRVVGVKTNSTSIKMKIGENFNLITLFVYADGNLKQIVNSTKYLYDRTIKNNTSTTKYETIVTGDKITYSSSDNQVAEVNNLGYIQSKKTGTAVITIKGLGWTARAIVTVN
ncbi:DUF6273 domain-containing protein [Clostridium sp. DJ247]|uniref:DUF6273 domain-containing protein n=1 Tax=Clostridium sp. DJ247 TaxID=2726188 RepID=UPI00162501B5|nr:DUF6273 domain-containing protein [Clostridium sp. DJ247]MBC2581577.1 hypothetical protein [Clostridium sp. DJ247]